MTFRSPSQTKAALSLQQTKPRRTHLRKRWKLCPKPALRWFWLLSSLCIFAKCFFLLLFEFFSRKSSIQFCTSGVLIRNLTKCLTTSYNFLMHIHPLSFTCTHFIPDGPLRMVCSNANHLMITQPSPQLIWACSPLLNPEPLYALTLLLPRAVMWERLRQYWVAWLHHPADRYCCSVLTGLFFHWYSLILIFHHFIFYLHQQ